MKNIQFYLNYIYNISPFMEKIGRSYSLKNLSFSAQFCLSILHLSIPSSIYTFSLGINEWLYSVIALVPVRVKPLIFRLMSLTVENRLKNKIRPLMPLVNSNGNKRVVYTCKLKYNKKHATVNFLHVGV